MSEARILVVEDEPEIANYLRRGLIFAGYEVDLAPDGLRALELVREQPPDLVVLDLMLPEIDGLEVAKRLRAVSPLPIIMLTARDAVDDRVEGLMAGADDYMIKPFAFKELLARIQVQLRRQAAQATGEILHYGPLRLDVAARTVSIGGKTVQLTAKEFDLLELFARHPGQVLTRGVIYDRVWGYDFGGDSNVIEVYIRGIRQKLEAGGQTRLLQTVRGVGYALRHDVEG
jgi:two-component system, OmpR family, response regulator MprA